MNLTTAPQRGVFASFMLLLISIMLSAQAFDVAGLSYPITSETDVAVTGRAPSNTDNGTVIPETSPCIIWNI